MSLKITISKEFKNEYHELPKIEKETEKAIAVKILFRDGSTDEKGERLAWFPKSQIVDNKVKGWLFNAKVNDLRKTLSRNEFIYIVTIGDLVFQV